MIYHRPITIVVAEDEKIILNNIVKKIKNCGDQFKVVATASNGEIATELIDLHHPNLLITDIQMPIINGLDLVNYAKANHPDMKVIIISGYDEFEYARKALTYGVHDYLLKPISEDTLRKVLLDIKDQITNNITAMERDVVTSEIYGKNISEPLPTILQNSVYALVLINVGNLLTPDAHSSYDKQINQLWNHVDLVSYMDKTLSPNLNYFIVDEKLLNQKFVLISSEDASINSSYHFCEKLDAYLQDRLEGKPFTLNIYNKTISHRDISLTAEKVRRYVRKHQYIGQTGLVSVVDMAIKIELPSIEAQIKSDITSSYRMQDLDSVKEIIASLFEQWNSKHVPQLLVEKLIFGLISTISELSKTDSSDNYLQLEEQLSGLRIYAKSIQDCYGPVLNLIDETIVTNKQSRISSIELVNMICDYLENNYSKPLTLETISQLFNYSASYISASFKKNIRLVHL